MSEVMVHALLNGPIISVQELVKIYQNHKYGNSACGKLQSSTLLKRMHRYYFCYCFIMLLLLLSDKAATIPI